VKIKKALVFIVKALPKVDQSVIKLVEIRLYKWGTSDFLSNY